MQRKDAETFQPSGDVVVCIGTRPEAIKLVPVIAELSRVGLRARVHCSGQHVESVMEVLHDFEVRPDHIGHLERRDGSLAELRCATLMGAFESLRDLDPAWVVVQGDTTSALSYAEAAFYCGIPVAHVEAGLRTSNVRSPYPEEMNRRQISEIATLHLPPTERAADALRREGHVPTAATGNTGIDALYHALRDAHVDVTDRSLPSPERPGMLTITLHRRENWGRPIQNVCRAITEFIRQHPHWSATVAVHPNPSVQEGVRLALAHSPRVTVIGPQRYIEFAALLARSDLILTDSGGIQEEAPSLNVPVLVARQSTERTEGLEAGCLRLAGTDTDAVLAQLNEVASDGDLYRSMATAPSPYGDGNASRRVVRALMGGR
jgi:UDP-N-acetylglucosamine 2-epimerase (non-hydrolysing)